MYSLPVHTYSLQLAKDCLRYNNTTQVERTMSYGVNFQRNLDKYMETEGISHNSVSKKTGVSQKTVWACATGRSVPTLNTAEIVANAVGLDPRVMLGEELTPQQIGRSAKIGRMLDQLIGLNLEQLDTVGGVLRAFTSTE